MTGRPFGSLNLDWLVLTIILVAIICSGIFVYVQVQENYNLLAVQMQRSTERYQANRDLILKMGEESRARDEAADDHLNRWTKEQHDKWCQDAVRLNPGWRCPPD